MAKTKDQAVEALNTNAYAATIAGQIERIEDSKTVVVNKLNELKGSPVEATLDEAALDLNSIPKYSQEFAMEEKRLALPDGYYTGASVLLGDVSEEYKLQAKSYTPTKKAYTVQEDDGFYGLSQVTVNPIPVAYQDVTGVNVTADNLVVGQHAIKVVDGVAQTVNGTMINRGSLSKTLDATESNQSITIQPGKYTGGSINVVLEEKTVNCAPAGQTITPTKGKVLSSVTIKPIAHTAHNAPTFDWDPVTGTFTAKHSQTVGYVADGSELTASKTLDCLDSSDVTKKGAVVTVPAGYYPNGATESYTIHTPSQAYVGVSSTGQLQLTKASVTEGYNNALVGGTSPINLAEHDVNFKAVNIKHGVNLFGTAGTFTSSATLTEGYSGAVGADILANKSAFLNGVEVKGTMPNNGTVTKSLTTSASSYTITKGYHDGQGTVSVFTTTKAPEFNPAGEIVKASGAFLTQVTIKPVPGNATAANILVGNTAYANGTEIEGAMANKGAFNDSIDIMTLGAVKHSKSDNRGCYSSTASSVNNDVLYARLEAI